jgi:hypothetical protein
MKNQIMLAALLTALAAVPVVIERTRDVPPDVWTGAAPTERVITQDMRDREMRDKMLAEKRPDLLAQVKIYVPINAISSTCDLRAINKNANSGMLEGVKWDPEAAKLVGRLHWETQAAYRAARDKAAFCSDFLAANGQSAKAGFFGWK